MELARNVPTTPELIMLREHALLISVTLAHKFFRLMEHVRRVLVLRNLIQQIETVLVLHKLSHPADKQ